MENIYPRHRYLDILKQHIDEPVIKILSGVRRCGKSSILTSLEEELLSRGVEQDRIIKIDFREAKKKEPEHPKTLSQYFSRQTISDSWVKQLTNPEKLSHYLMSKVSDENRYYLFLYEIQNVPHWEDCLTSLLDLGNVDLYLTTSVSTPVSEPLSGKYIDIPIQTLTFSEYKVFYDVAKPGRKINRIYEDYLRGYLTLGGFPYTHFIGCYFQDEALAVLAEKYDDEDEWMDFTYYFRYFCELMQGRHRFSLDRYKDFFSFNMEKAMAILKYLEETFAILKVPIYDILEKRIITTSCKYFFSDISFNHIMWGGLHNFGSVGYFDNLLYLELISRGYTVMVGKLGDEEISFIVEKDGNIQYVQTHDIFHGEIYDIKDEIAPLLKTDDQYPKYLLTNKPTSKEVMKNIYCMNISEYLDLLP